MTTNGLLLSIGMIICIGAANTEDMSALIILSSLGLGLMIMGVKE